MKSPLRPGRALLLLCACGLLPDLAAWAQSDSGSGAPSFITGLPDKETDFRLDDPMLQVRLPAGSDAEIADSIEQTSPALTPTEARLFKNSLHWLLQAAREATPSDPAAARHATYARIRGLTYLQAMHAGYELQVERTHREYEAAFKRKQANEAVLANPASTPGQKALAESNLRILEGKLSLLLREYNDSNAEIHLLMGDKDRKTSPP
ncbi:MAG: hypothetical protein ACHQ5A_14330, partial [Opitutales bacterium]